jgi:hypothetical protein
MGRLFNGSSDTISITPTMPAVAGQTIAIWVNPANLNSTFQAVWYPGSPGAVLYLNSSNTWLYAGAVANIIGPAASQGSWTHLALTFDSGTTNVILWVNGANAANANQNASGLAASGSHTGTFGSVTAVNFFNGSMTDAAFWTTKFTPAQISALAAGTRPVNVNSANLLWWLPLDGYQSPEPDLSGNGNNGTLTGTTQVLGAPQLWRLG